MADVTYVNVPIETEPYELAQLSFDYMDANVPGWVPSDGQLDTWLISALAQQAAELRDVASDVPSAIFRYFGAKLMNIQPLDPVSATVAVTITVKDNAGYTIPAGYAAGIRDANGIMYGFLTTVDVVIPAGSVATAAGAVTLSAAEPGVDASGLGANGTAMELITALDTVTSVVMTAATGGGQDAEEDEDYLTRLVRDLALQAPRPIIANDFAQFALNTPGVYRAIAIDGYDPGLATYNNARTVTIACINSAGAACSAPVKAAVLADLSARREVNFLVYVIDPTYTNIDVQFDVTVFAGWDAAAVKAEIIAALQSYLNPINWGLPAGTDSVSWSGMNTVKQLDLASIIGTVQGVRDINSVTFRVHAVGGYATADIVLPGAAPLPTSGTIDGTVA